MKNKGKILFTLIIILLTVLAGWLLMRNYAQVEELLGLKEAANSMESIQPVQPESNPYTATQTQNNSPDLTQTPLPPIQPSLTSDTDTNYLLLLSMQDENFVHLFIYNPETTNLTRLSNDAWNDTAPVISPDGSKIAFSSNRNGYWNIYVMQLVNGQVEQITDTFAYNSNPTWSPDGLWIAYDAYEENNFNILISSSNDPQEPIIKLTNDNDHELDPAWSPDGRAIAYAHVKDGFSDIEMINLDNENNRLIMLSDSPEINEYDPAWSSDGSAISWSASENGVQNLYIYVNGQSKYLASGGQHIWSQHSALIYTEIEMPNYTLLSAYDANTGLVLLPPITLPGNLYGMDTCSDPQTIEHLLSLSESEPYQKPQMWQRALSEDALPGDRSKIITLENIDAPYAFLHDSVDETFYALKEQTSKEIGWDFLSSLENAYLPITEPPLPNQQINWLYTGRAFAANPASMYANWMVVVREDHFGQTWWRIYLKTRHQDGSQGKPLTTLPWDFEARYQGDPQSFEAGGQPGSLPDGYWVDFTDIALRYGWERLSSLMNWRSYMEGTRFNQYYITDGLEWDAAMRDVYPPELLNTATSIPTWVLTKSPTPEFTKRYTDTPTPTLTSTPTNQPTWTSSP